MKKRGGIGAVTVTPVRCSMGPARPACLTALIPLRLRLPGGGIRSGGNGLWPLRRGGPLARRRRRRLESGGGLPPAFCSDPAARERPAKGLQGAGATS